MRELSAGDVSRQSFFLMSTLQQCIIKFTIATAPSLYERLFFVEKVYREQQQHVTAEKQTDFFIFMYNFCCKMFLLLFIFIVCVTYACCFPWWILNSGTNVLYCRDQYWSSVVVVGVFPLTIFKIIRAWSTSRLTRTGENDYAIWQPKHIAWYCFWFFRTGERTGRIMFYFSQCNMYTA